MKQVTVELDDETHALLKQRAQINFRKIGAQLLFEALAASREDTKATSKRTRKQAKVPA